jgi:hypothetical protein
MKNTTPVLVSMKTDDVKNLEALSRRYFGEGKVYKTKTVREALARCAEAELGIARLKTDVSSQTVSLESDESPTT